MQVRLYSLCFFLQEPTYNPQVEAISPTLPPDETSQSSKDQLLQAISKVDREISKVDKDIQKLKKKQVWQIMQIILVFMSPVTWVTCCY